MLIAELTAAPPLLVKSIVDFDHDAGSSGTSDAAAPAKSKSVETSVMNVALVAHGPDGVPREVSRLNTSVASAAVCTGMRPMAMSATPSPVKSPIQSSDAVFIRPVVTSFVGTKSMLMLVPW